MQPFYQYAEGYKGNDRQALAFLEKYKDDPWFPRGRNLSEDIDFWADYYERFLLKVYCSNELKVGFHRLFGYYKHDNEADKNNAEAEPLFVTDTGPYALGFTKKIDIMELSNEYRIPEKARLFYKKLVSVYEEFNSLYAVPSRDDDITQFLIWWCKTNLFSDIFADIYNAGPERELSVRELSYIICECTGVNAKYQALEKLLTSTFGCDVSNDSIKVDADIPLFRRGFLDEPCKEGVFLWA